MTKACCRADCEYSNVRSSRRVIRPTATSPPTRRWCWPSRPAEAARSRRSLQGQRWRRDEGVASVRGRRAGLHQHAASGTVPGPNCWRAILRGRPKTSRASDLAAGTPVNVEYVSANPTGPMHVGHSRSAVFGDALANLLAFDRLSVARILHQRRRRAGRCARPLGLPALPRGAGRDIGEIPEGLYPGDYLVPVGQALAERMATRGRPSDEAEWLPEVRRQGRRHDDGHDPRRPRGRGHAPRRVLFERALSEGDDRWPRRSTDLEAQGYVYTGVLEPPKGKKPEDWEDRETAVQVDRVRRRHRPPAQEVRRQSYTYFAADMAYHRDKFARGYPR